MELLTLKVYIHRFDLFSNIGVVLINAIDDFFKYGMDGIL